MLLLGNLVIRETNDSMNEIYNVYASTNLKNLEVKEINGKLELVGKWEDAREEFMKIFGNRIDTKTNIIDFISDLIDHST